MKLRYKILTAIFLISVFLILPVFGTGAMWIRHVGLLPSTAVVFSGDAAAMDRFMAAALKPYYGDRVGICDGVNDHVEIQAALDAVYEVSLREGTFNIEASLDLDSYQTLRGCGRNSILATSTAGLIFLSATGGSGTEKVGITISDMRIDGASISSHGIQFTYVDHSRIKNIHVQDSDDTGIYLITSDFNTIRDNTCQRSGLYGIDIEESNYNKISINTVQDCLAEAILLDSTSSGNTVTGNIIKDNYNGIYLGPASFDNTISGNTCVGNGVGIYVEGGDSTIASNVCNSNDKQGIVVTNGFGITIVGNTCTFNGFQGIAIVVAYEVLIGNNICECNSQDTDNTWSNILIDDSFDVLVTANFCRRCGGANQPQYGIKIAGTVGRIIVQGNDLYNGGRTGNLLDNHAGTGASTIIRNDNEGITITQVREYANVKNTSGGACVIGEVVRHKAVAAGDEYDTPTAIGEDSVLGMVAENTDNNEYGPVLVAGGTTILKATNAGGNIAIGDYLCTENGVRARLAGVGDMAFARALETCNAADCIIDALIISPRKM